MKAYTHDRKYLKQIDESYARMGIDVKRSCMTFLIPPYFHPIPNSEYFIRIVERDALVPEPLFSGTRRSLKATRRFRRRSNWLGRWPMSGRWRFIQHSVTARCVYWTLAELEGQRVATRRFLVSTRSNKLLLKPLSPCRSARTGANTRDKHACRRSALHSSFIERYRRKATKRLRASLQPFPRVKK